LKQSERVLRLPALVCRATRVEEQEADFVFQKGDVRVAEDDDAGFGEALLEALTTAFFSSRVVDHGYLHTAEVELQGLRQGHPWRVHVTLDGVDRGVGGEFVEHRRHDQVPGVQYQVGLLQVRNQPSGQGVGAAGYVGVGEDDS